MAKPIRLVQTELVEHPATQAWERVRPSSAEPVQIQVLKQKHKSGVYRLVGAAPDGAAVIAKRSRRATVWVERIVYEEVLPRASVSQVGCYGCCEELEYCWIFFEDAGSSGYSARLTPHREAAGRWLAALHDDVVSNGLGARLPDKGPCHYLDRLRAARDRIVSFAFGSALTEADRIQLDALVSQCDALEARWDRVEQSCHRMPRTLVHGDFHTKNVRLRTNTDGSVSLLVLDWESAGWGVPAIDIAQIDPDVYWSAARERRPGLDLPVLEELARVGRIFEWLAAIDWETTRLHATWLEKPMHRIRPCAAELRAACAATGWWS